MGAFYITVRTTPARGLRLRARLGLDRAHCVVGAVGAGFTLERGIDPGGLAR